MNAKRICALVLALLMVFSLTACGGNGEEEIEEVIEYEYVSGENQGGDANGDAGDAQQGTNNQTGTQNGNQNGNQTGNQTGNNNTNNNNNTQISTGKVDPKKYKGTTVRYATWKNARTNGDEDGPVIESFEKKYGIKVQLDLIGQGEYNKKISGFIAANQNIPDIYFCTGTWPACIKNLQPLDAMKLDMTDPIWDQDFMNYFSIDGKKYLATTVSNIWNETTVLFYNKKVLQMAGYTDPVGTIDNLVKQGKWNYDNFEKMLKAVDDIGSDYLGAYLSESHFITSTGANWFSYKNGQYDVTFDNKLIDAVKQYATWIRAGLITSEFAKIDNFTYDKLGFVASDAFGLKKTGFFGGIRGRKMDPNLIGFTYLPDPSASQKAVASGSIRGYGLIKGAPNPVGAGIFLRYYLDVNNYDLDQAFISKAASDFFFKLTAPNRMKTQNFAHSSGLESMRTSLQASIEAWPINNSPDQIATVVKGQTAAYTAIIKDINRTIKNDLAGK